MVVADGLNYYLRYRNKMKIHNNFTQTDHFFSEVGFRPQPQSEHGTTHKNAGFVGRAQHTLCDTSTTF